MNDRLHIYDLLHTDRPAITLDLDYVVKLAQTIMSLRVAIRHLLFFTQQYSQTVTPRKELVALFFFFHEYY